MKTSWKFPLIDSCFVDNHETKCKFYYNTCNFVDNFNLENETSLNLLYIFFIILICNTFFSLQLWCPRSSLRTGHSLGRWKCLQ